ncbi:Hypothetical protein, putative [Bodo saltans]|uniref:Uncharacterized protein n=1 Tax=Bodo saltans TaxID=75058 RepID=A0A0S4J8J5_BODSA|nr:Hypothetical protein, putative [Bodo saltans]|eukprot:CUG86426.1 Hypothetical protein, putative [Bodo saltans]
MGTACSAPQDVGCDKQRLHGDSEIHVHRANATAIPTVAFDSHNNDDGLCANKHFIPPDQLPAAYQHELLLRHTPSSTSAEQQEFRRGTTSVTATCVSEQLLTAATGIPTKVPPLAAVWRQAFPPPPCSGTASSHTDSSPSHFLWSSTTSGGGGASDTNCDVLLLLESHHVRSAAPCKSSTSADIPDTKAHHHHRHCEVRLSLPEAPADADAALSTRSLDSSSSRHSHVSFLPHAVVLGESHGGGDTYEQHVGSTPVTVVQRHQKPNYWSSHPPADIDGANSNNATKACDVDEEVVSPQSFLSTTDGESFLLDVSSLARGSSNRGGGDVLVPLSLTIPHRKNIAQKKRQAQ